MWSGLSCSTTERSIICAKQENAEEESTVARAPRRGGRTRATRAPALATVEEEEELVPTGAADSQPGHAVLHEPQHAQEAPAMPRPRRGRAALAPVEGTLLLLVAR